MLPNSGNQQTFVVVHLKTGAAAHHCNRSSLIFGAKFLFWLHLKIHPMIVLKIYQLLEKYRLTDAVLIVLIVIMKVLYKMIKA